MKIQSLGGQFKKFKYVPTVALDLIRVHPKDLAKPKMDAASAKAEKKAVVPETETVVSDAHY